MNSNNSKSDEITIWLEQYKQVNDEIRNYRDVHWQIATVLFVLMTGIIGYGLPNVEGNWGKFWVCVSASLIFILHTTTYCYFQKIEDIKKSDRKKIIREIKKITTHDYFLEKIDETNLKENNQMSCFWDHHPIFGFIFIGIALALFAVAFLFYPKNHQDDAQNVSISRVGCISRPISEPQEGRSLQPRP